MVLHGDFKIELVYADTKMPFKEHTKDDKIYVEVEPDVEYFIKFQQTGTGRGGYTISKFIVDEQDLGYILPTNSSTSMSKPMYCGLWTQEKGVSSQKVRIGTVLPDSTCTYIHTVVGLTHVVVP
jgi:hypothetical protein